MFPNPADLEKYNLTPQNKSWEKPLCTEEQAQERLIVWVEKRLRREQVEFYKAIMEFEKEDRRK